MRKLLITLLLAGQAHAVGPDKVAHTVGSAGMTTAVYFTMTAFTGREHQLRTTSLLCSILFTGAFVYAHEQMESNVFDAEDMKANLIGIGAAGLVLYFLDIENVRPHPSGVAIEF